jgi:hypothetical protein
LLLLEGTDVNCSASLRFTSWSEVCLGCTWLGDCYVNCKRSRSTDVWGSQKTTAGVVLLCCCLHSEFFMCKSYWRFSILIQHSTWCILEKSTIWFNWYINFC